MNAKIINCVHLNRCIEITKTHKYDYSKYLIGGTSSE
jgi:hypothetical protein